LLDLFHAIVDIFFGHKRIFVKTGLKKQDFASGKRPKPEKVNCLLILYMAGLVLKNKCKDKEFSMYAKARRRKVFYISLRFSAFAYKFPL
jgi:hypothetical protein